jgi:hypothetical protein
VADVGSRPPGGRFVVRPGHRRKMIAVAKQTGPACHPARTNNHAERANRKLRYQEKARSKWRGRRRIVRFLVRLLERWWVQERAIRIRWREEPDGGGAQSTILEAAPGRRIACRAIEALAGSARSVKNRAALTIWAAFIG